MLIKLNRISISFNSLRSYPQTIRCCSQLELGNETAGVREFKIKRNNQFDETNVTLDNQHIVIEEIATPLSRIPYVTQLREKQLIAWKTVRAIRQETYSFYNEVTIHPIVPSPVQEEYRNKDEFSVGVGVDGNRKTFGLFTGKPGLGKVYCIKPTNVRIIKKLHKVILEIFQDFIDKSSLPASYSLDDRGFWRRLLVKSNTDGDSMVIAVGHVTQPEDVVKKEMDSLKQHFADCGIPITSLYYQLCKQVFCFKENSIQELLSGERYIYQDILGSKFRISPDSFFQINVKAAEVLYTEILTLLELKESDTLLDLCCGTGAFSILASRHVRSCIGIDSLYGSIEDARQNALLNDITNCEFIPGTVEGTLRTALETLDSASNIIVVLNPGRAGVHSHVIHLLRSEPHIRKIVYVSCKPDHPRVQKNFSMLLDRKNNRTQPFVITEAKPVDMFPHTYHYELVLIFQR